MQSVKRKTTSQNLKYFKFLVVVFSFSLFAFSLNFVSASSHLTNQPGINLTIQDVLGIITGLACWISEVALVFIVIAIVYYGVRFLTAQGDPAKLTEARKSFLWGLVGVLVILGTYTIIATVANALGADYTLFIPLRCS